MRLVAQLTIPYRDKKPTQNSGKNPLTQKTNMPFPPLYRICSFLVGIMFVMVVPFV